jgi:hypothetical protein
LFSDPGRVSKQLERDHVADPVDGYEERTVDADARAVLFDLAEWQFLTHPIHELGFCQAFAECQK